MGWIIWTIGIIIFLIIVIIIRKKLKGEDEDDLWGQVNRIKRGACAKLKEKLFGC